jgi:hypothetical protein
MRKHPLIALTAFTALTASAIAGASTGSFESNTILTSARATHRPSQPALREEARVVLVAESYAHQTRPFGRSLVVLHDLSRPSGIRLSSVTGLPVAPRAKPKPKPKPKVVEAVVPAPVVWVAPAPVAPAPAPVVTTTTVPNTAPSGGVWYELRMCEASGNYAENTGNGYYGAYQFSLSTWYGLGFTGLPSEASPSEQDAAAAELQARSGWGQWPTCSAELGL